jgi:hypothetical protein
VVPATAAMVTVSLRPTSIANSKPRFANAALIVGAGSFWTLRRPVPVAGDAAPGHQIQGRDRAIALPDDERAGEAKRNGSVKISTRAAHLLRRDLRLVKHLPGERSTLLTFLADPNVDAANWRGEQAIRPAVVNRK